MNILRKVSVLLSFFPLFSFAQNSAPVDLGAIARNLPYNNKGMFIGKTESVGIKPIKTGFIQVGKMSFNDADGFTIVNLNEIHTPQIEQLKNTDENIEQRYIRLFVGAGISFNTIDISGTPTLYNLKPASYNSVGPKISAGINIYPVPAVARSVFRLEASYMTASYKTTADLYYQAPVVKTVYQLQQHTFSITPQFQYNFYNTDQFKVYGDAGVSANISGYNGNQVYNSYTEQNQTDYFGTKKFWFSVPVKAGVIVNRNIEISLAYIYAQSISDDTAGAYQNSNYSIRIHSLQLGINYLF